MSVLEGELPERSAVELVSVVVADDQPAARRGVRAILEHASSPPRFRVVAECGEPDDVLAAVERGAPAVVVADLMHSGNDGVRLIRRLRSFRERSPVLVYTTTGNAVLAAMCLAAGARGFLPKVAPADELIRAVETVASGRTFLPDAWTAPPPRRPPRRRRLTDGARDGLELLSPAELEVLQLIGQGRETPEIAQRLGRNPKTVETYRSRLRAKLELANSTQLAQFAWRVFFDSRLHLSSAAYWVASHLAEFLHPLKLGGI